MSNRTVLYICHNHPSVRPGGAEAYAYELHKAMRESTSFSPVFLAKGGPPVGTVGQQHPGTCFAPVDAGDDADQYFFYTDGYDFDYLQGTMPGKDFYTKHFRSFLEAYRPDVVHFQHTLFLGFDMIREVRNTLPDAAIVYTLHEFLPICHRNGQMVRTVNDDELCTHESPLRCHECFRDITPQTFFLRKRFVQSHFELVDQFIAPSQFLLERYVAWGIPREQIRFEEYGRLPVDQVAPVDDRPVRNRFGFFGQLSAFKGIDVLLEAMQLLSSEADAHRGSRGPFALAAAEGDRAARPKAHLAVHGANLELQHGTFRSRFDDLVEANGASVTFVGKYDHEQLPSLMRHVDWVVVPSIWWENSPLVIQEAFAHGRPVICSDIGGMAEKVQDGVTGLHFRVRSARSLAAAIETAATTDGLWDRLRQAIPPVYDMERHAKELTVLYEDLLHQRAGR